MSSKTPYACSVKDGFNRAIKAREQLTEQGLQPFSVNNGVGHQPQELGLAKSFLAFAEWTDH